eukprot:m.85858 g.85858  ORF g.85858 m.85858 type:complete len:292 (-) comp25903_c0_seq1:129-1004(-)
MMLTLALMAVATVSRSGPGTGPYSTTHATYTYEKMDETSKKIDVCQPVAKTPGQQFPLIAFAHGFMDEAYEVYHDLFEEFASWGYVVAAPLACQYGCLSDCHDDPLDPPCYKEYYQQQLLTIEWANNQSALPINVSMGCAVAGHSMGGQATLFSAAYNSTTHNIKVAGMLHAFTHTYPAITTVPFLTFTGTDDDVAPPEMADKIFGATGASPDRGLINKVGANHHEPSTDYNQKLAAATIAWFKVWLDRTPQALGVDFEARIYGNGTDSVCGGFDGKMKACTIVGGPPPSM